MNKNIRLVGWARWIVLHGNAPGKGPDQASFRSAPRPQSLPNGNLAVTKLRASLVRRGLVQAEIRCPFHAAALPVLGVGIIDRLLRSRPVFAVDGHEMVVDLLQVYDAFRRHDACPANVDH